MSSRLAARNLRWARPGRRTAGAAIRLLSLALLFGAWEIYGRASGGFLMPPPSRVVVALAESFPQLIELSGVTLFAAFVGLLLSTVVGLVLGFAIPLFPWARNTLDPLVDAAYAIPITMLIPMIGIYVGLGFTGRVFVVFMFVAMIIVVNTSAGVRSVDRDLLETARSYGASGLTLWRKVIFPSALTHIGAGFSLGVSRALRAAIAGEILLISAGLGGFIIRAGGIFQMPVLFAGLLWTVVLAYGMYAAALYFERRLLRWQDPGVPTERSGL